MAGVQLTGVLSIYDSGYRGDAPGTGIVREDLLPIITLMSPQDTVTLNWLPKRVAQNIVHESPYDTLPTASLAGFTDGAQFGTDTPTTPKRLRNFTHIFRRDVSVTRSDGKSSVAGIPNKFNYQVYNSTKAVAIAINKRFYGNKSVGNTTNDYGGAPTVGSSTTQVRRMKGFPHFVSAYNDFTDSAYTDVNINSVQAGTNGVLPLTPALVDSALVLAFNQGGNPRFLMVPPGVKVGFSNQIRGESTAARYVMNAEEKRASRAFDVYEGDLGELAVMVDRRIPQTSVTTTGSGYQSGAAWMFDRERVALAFYDPIHFKPFGITADVDNMGIVVGEACIELTGPDAHACIYGITA